VAEPACDLVGLPRTGSGIGRWYRADDADRAVREGAWRHPGKRGRPGFYRNRLQQQPRHPDGDRARTRSCAWPPCPSTARPVPSRIAMAPSHG